MKLKGKLTQLKEGLITFEVSHNVGLELGKDYSVEIKPYKDNRSLEQNALLWLLIGKLAKIQNKTEWEIYLDIMENCKVSPEYILALPQTEKMLKNSFRVVIPLDETREVNGKTLIVYKCQVGSSKLNKEQFKELLEYTLLICSEFGIYTGEI